MQEPDLVKLCGLMETAQKGVEVEDPGGQLGEKKGAESAWARGDGRLRRRLVITLMIGHFLKL